MPEDLATTPGRDNHNGHIIMKNTKLDMYRNSFVFRGAVLWNKLPRLLRVGEKLGKFKSDLKNWIVKNVPRFDE